MWIVRFPQDDYDDVFIGPFSEEGDADLYASEHEPQDDGDWRPEVHRLVAASAPTTQWRRTS